MRNCKADSCSRDIGLRPQSYENLSSEIKELLSATKHSKINLIFSDSQCATKQKTHKTTDQTKHLVSSMQPSTLHSITVLDPSYHESGGNTLIWKANVITLKKEGKCSICWHHSSIYLPSFQGTHSWQSKLWCICAPRCFLWELSHAASGAPRQVSVCATQRTRGQGVCTSPRKAALTAST